MSKSNAKEKLHRCFDCLDAKVVVLSGPWGCGKTFLLNEEFLVKESSGLYASLFGVSSLEEIKKI